jgi:hypothetical protein
MGDFKGLNLDQSLIQKAIDKYCKNNFSNYTIFPPEKIRGGYKYSIKINSNDLLLNVYFNNNGTTTLTPSGKNQDMTLDLAEYIKEKCKYCERKALNISLRNVNSEIIKNLLSYLTEDWSAKITKEDKKTCESYKIIGCNGDTVTLNYYATGTLQLQGLALKIMNEILDYLRTDPSFSFDDVIKHQSDFLKMDINKDEIQQEYEAKLPTVYTFLEDTGKKIMSPALIMKRYDIPFDDYSLTVFPVLRGLEAFTKKLFLLKNITIPKEGFTNFFDIIGTGDKFTLKENWSRQINNLSLTKGIERSYSYYNKHRHGLFHADGNLSFTRLIETKADADIIIDEVFNLMEEVYSSII